MQAVTVLGSTGSIGKSTIDVLLRNKNRYEVFALTAHSQVELLLEQCEICTPRYAVIGDTEKGQWLQQALSEKGIATKVLSGSSALEQVASDAFCDVVMAAIVGAAGLLPTLAAVKAGKKVLLANKESLVMAGQLFMDEVKASGARLLPVDSEHNAIFQCMEKIAEGKTLSQLCVEKILLTGSGGPLRTMPVDELDTVTPEMACAHPNWSMGKKISVDSATMMNKGLELIEACWLFDTTPEQIQVVLHPQSIIHSMVQFSDGSTLAQMGNPDMRTPIAHALAWPERIDAGVKPLDLFDVARLDFEEIDSQRFPALDLARKAFSMGGTAPAILNAANEISVEAFLQGEIAFTDIEKINAKTLSNVKLTEPNSIDVVLEADNKARAYAQSEIKSC